MPDLELSLPPDASAPGRARAALAPLQPRIPPAAFENLRLLVTEVVTNSLRHAGLTDGDSIGLAVSILTDRVVVECRDPGPGFRAPVHGTPHDPGQGWGLYLVDRLADRWGTEPGRLVRTWFEIHLER
jgi:anti-sigma regulatory factor (Ser/Thr protein kinase)